MIIIQRILDTQISLDIERIGQPYNNQTLPVKKGPQMKKTVSSKHSTDPFGVSYKATESVGDAGEQLGVPCVMLIHSVLTLLLTESISDVKDYGE